VSLRHEHPGSDELIRHHVHPGIARIQTELQASVALDRVLQLGKPPKSPAVTVIVPLYKQLSFLEYQMAHWASDPHVATQDLVYVLDSPEQAVALEAQARGLYSLYGIPFRIAVMKVNAGFAGVNNCAVELARAGKLVLLNSDVVPDAPGWLERMDAFYDATPQIGALGPKLLYEDDSIQHAGVYFHPTEQSGVWENMHYLKGQHRTYPPSDVARVVPAVTGACLMVTREHYEQVGGLSHRYVQGGYEDTDFCLRLGEEGLDQWYMPGSELYHLEDQSYPSHIRKIATRYNMWLQSELWAERIERLMAEF
jgi:GT2 family glycosyltransferase